MVLGHSIAIHYLYLATTAIQSKALEVAPFQVAFGDERRSILYRSVCCAFALIFSIKEWESSVTYVSHPEFLDSPVSLLMGNSVTQIQSGMSFVGRNDGEQPVWFAAWNLFYTTSVSSIAHHKV